MMFFLFWDCWYGVDQEHKFLTSEGPASNHITFRRDLSPSDSDVKKPIKFR